MTELLRALTIGAWLAPLCTLFLPMVRAVRGTGDEHLKALLWFISLVFIGFNIAYLSVPGVQIVLWVLLTMSTLCAVGVFWYTHDAR